jgi:hypothetical protein
MNPPPRQATPSVFRLTSYVSLFLFLFSIYLLSYTPRINSSDGLAMFSTAESMVRRGALDIEQIRWMDLQQGTYGLDGLLYSRKGIGVPVGLLPLTWLGFIVPWWGTVSASLLFNAIVTALTAVLLWAYLQQLGFSQRTGLIVALTFGLATLAWPYAKSLFSDPFSGLLLLAAAYALLKYSGGAAPTGGFAREQGSRGEKFLSPSLFYPLLAGLFLGWNIATRYAEALFVPVFGLLLLYYLFNLQGSKFYASEPKAPYGRLTLYVLAPILAFVTPLLLIGLALIYFNLSRYGDPFNTGYLPNETFSGILRQGLFGQLFSPGRGLFLYCPIFLLSLVGFFPFFRRYRPEAIAALSVIIIHLFLYGQWFMWHGGYAWGPRFMVPTLPFWAIFLAPVVASAFPEIRVDEEARTGRKFRLVYIALATLSLIPQLLSVAIDFGPFQNSLLDTGLPLFDPQTFFDPKYSPFAGAWKFITLDSLDLAWAWQGQVNGWLLLVLMINIILSAFNLRAGESMNQRLSYRAQAPNDDSSNLVTWSSSLALLSTLAAVTFLLTHAHSLPAPPLTRAVVALNEGVRPNDAVITNNPESAQPFAELYKGRAVVLGLNSGGPPLPGDTNRRIYDMMANQQQVWWLPNGLSSEHSAVEEMLMMNGFRARNDNFEGERLVLFTFPPRLTANPVAVGAIFGDQIKLVEVAYPAQVSAGSALPVELNWQALVELSQDYHVFIHLVAENGQTVAQADGQPALWLRPTTTWAKGETIVDRHGLWIPAQTARGDYVLRMGLYRPEDGQRLHLTTGEEWISLAVSIE